MEPTEYVRRYLEWTEENPKANYVVFSMVTNQGASGPARNQSPAVASYAHGFLRSDDQGGLAGRVTSYLSDRQRPGSPPAPFDPTQTDDLGVEIALDGGAATVTLVDHSWGGGRQTLAGLRHEDEVLVGTGGSVGNQTATAVYVVSLGTTVAPN